MKMNDLENFIGNPRNSPFSWSGLEESGRTHFMEVCWFSVCKFANWVNTYV